MVRFELLHPKMTLEHLGFIPQMLNPQDPRPAAEQFDKNYAHGGGWSPNVGSAFKMDPATKTLKYPGDPAMKPLARAKFRDEEIYFYESAVVAIVQSNGTFEVSRMD